MKTVAAALAACALLAALVATERACSRRDDADANRIERLVPPDRIAGRTTAAFTIESGGRELLYLRSKGLWRCREAFGAVCQTDLVESFLTRVVEARGALVCAGSDCAERAGLAADDGLRLALHGSKVLSDPERDTFARIAFAPSRAEATFAEYAGTDRVLAIDRDPRALLDATGLPAPLVDTRLLAGCFAPGFAGFQRIFVDRGESSIELSSAAPDEGAERTWQLTSQGSRQDALLWRVGGYVSLFVRLRWDRAEDPRGAAALGLDPPHASITLAPNVGDPFEIRVSAPDAANRIHVWNRATNVVATVRAELLPLLVPEAAEFTRTEGGNPWEAWLAPR